MRSLAVALLLALAPALALAGCTSPEGAPADLMRRDAAPQDALPASPASPTVAPAPSPTAAPGPTVAPTPAASATPAPRPLTVRVEATGTGALEWLPLVAVPSEAASCAWSGDEGVVFEDPAACATRVMAPAAGNWSVAVRATAGGRSADGAAVLEATLPQADGSVTGSLYAYNEAQGQTVGLSNVLAEAAGRPVYPPEAQVVLSARSVEGDGVDDATPAVAFLLDGNGTVWGGPLPLAGGDEASGALPGTGWRFDSEPWTLPAEAGAGVYLLAVRLEVAGQQVWVQDGDGAAPGGHKEIQVVAAP